MKLKKIIKEGKKLVVGIGILLLPYIVMNSCDSNLYALKSGNREYFECAALRTEKARKSTIKLQKELYENIKEFFK